MFSKIKPVQHSDIEETFAKMLHEMIRKGVLPNYYWVQVCYKNNMPYEVIHLVFEKNSTNQEFIFWPVKWEINNIGITNLDFTQLPPKIVEKDSEEWVCKEWDYKTWHTRALNCNLTHSPEAFPKSFWKWREMTAPIGNLACDTDAIFNIEGRWVLLEATQIYYINEDISNPERDFYTHFYRLFSYRKKQTGRGFNWGQLYAQSNLSKLLGAKQFLLLHQINNQREVVSERVAYIELDSKKIDALSKISEKYCSSSKDQQRTGKNFASELEVKFISLEEFFTGLRTGRL